MTSAEVVRQPDHSTSDAAQAARSFVRSACATLHFGGISGRIRSARRRKSIALVEIRIAKRRAIEHPLPEQHRRCIRVPAIVPLVTRSPGVLAKSDIDES